MSKKPLKERLSVEGKFVPSLWWGRGVRLLAKILRRPVATVSPPPPSGRWTPPTGRRMAEPRRADVRRMNRLGRRARESGMGPADIPTAPGRPALSIHDQGEPNIERPQIPGASSDNVP